MSSNRVITHPTRTKVYRALLVALDGDADAAMKAYTAQANANNVQLAEVGFSEKQAEAITTEKPKSKKKKDKAPKSVKEKAEALVAKRGLAFTRGRVYVTPEIVEAQVRVLKGGKPEVVKTSGAGRVDSVLIFRTEGGDAAVQNLSKPV